MVFFSWLSRAELLPVGVVISADLLPPSQIPVQLKANVEIGIGADIGAGVAVAVGVPIVARGDVVGLRGRQGAGSCGEDDGQSKCGLAEHGIYLLALSGADLNDRTVRSIKSPRQNIKMTEPFRHSDAMAGHVDADDLAYRSGSSADPILRITLSSLGDSERCRRTVGELF